MWPRLSIAISWAIWLWFGFVKQSSFQGQVIWGSFRNTFGGSSGRERINSLVLSAAFVLLLFGGEPRAGAQITILHSFGDGSVAGDGAVPEAGLIQAPDGNFYGVTYGQAGKTGVGGTVFRMTPAGVLTVIKRFPSQPLNAPDAPLLYYNNMLIGVVQDSPTKPNGALFAVTGYPDGPWGKYFFHRFTGMPDGTFPVGGGGLILGPNGDLYGTTNGGGSAGQGTIYKVNPVSHNFRVVYSFTDTTGAGVFPNTALVRANDGNFYGGAEGLFGGEIFEMTPNGQVQGVAGLTGNQFLTGPLTQGSDGNLYGTAGGLYQPIQIYPDMVFRFTTGAGGGVQFLVSEGEYGQTMGVIQGPNGNLYGLTYSDGTAGKGTVFEVSTAIPPFNVFHNFGDGTVQNDGENPVGTLVVGSDNNLYGTTGGGGSAGLGTVFRISP